MDRMVGVGALSREDTIAWGITGPLLRAAGVPFDLRKAQPYWAYDRMEFEVPLGKNGDNFDRYLVRMAEMEQAMRIAEQALEAHPRAAPSRWTTRGGRSIPTSTSTAASRARPRASCSCPITLSPNLQGQDRGASERVNVPRQARRAAAEGDRLRLHRRPDEPLHARHGRLRHPAPAGEAYVPVEGANGELGFYVVSDGTDRPYRRALPAAVPAPGGRAAADDRGRR